MRSAYIQAQKLAESDYQKWDSLFFEIKALREMKNWDDALKLIDAYLAGDNAANLKAGMIFVKGLIFNSKGDTDKGAELIEEALKCPELFGYMKEQAYFVLMNHFYQKRNLDKCIEYAKKAIADTTLNKTVITSAKFYNTQCTLDQAKYEEAQKLITEYAPDMQSDYYKARFAYIQALIHARNTEYEDAIKQFELVIKHEPKGWRAVQAAKQIKRLQNL
jgi:tetratricopeptide (TPR) repeat protein